MEATYQERFAQVLALFCGEMPSLPKIEAWIYNPESDEAVLLQDWVSSHLVLEWAQAIEVLEAAEQIASTPRR